MGHQLLGSMPASRKWVAVVTALTDNASAEAVASLSADAAEQAFTRARTSPDLIAAVELLAQLPQAARGPDYLDDLRKLGLALDAAPSLVELSTALLDALDRRAGAPSSFPSDVGVIARLAAVECLTALVAPQLPTLFGASPDDVRTAVGKLSSGSGFAVLAREFFSRLIYRTLDYYLSRAMGAHQGPGQRFAGMADRRQFEVMLETHCQEATRIISDYAGGWYGKHVYQQSGLTDTAIRSFVAYSLTKIRAELRARRDA